jgi:DNA processing protein
LESDVKFFFEKDFPSVFYENNAGIIFYKGRWENLKDSFFKIAIVGSRKALDLSISFVKETIKAIESSSKAEEVVIVSGLAKGIDSEALKAALSKNINTIAILGNGINYFYPSSNRFLQEEIAQKGLLLSEYPPCEKPKQYFFPYRNRLIACISEIVIVVQAKENSGSLITGNYALEMGKTLLVPFLQNTSEFQGSKELINSGGIMITQESEITNFLPTKLRKPKNLIKLQEMKEKAEKISETKINEIDLVFDIIKNNPGINIEELSFLVQKKYSNFNLSKAIEIATLLEIEGKISIDFSYTLYAIKD